MTQEFTPIEAAAPQAVVRVLIASVQPLFLDGIEVCLGRELDLRVVGRGVPDGSLRRLVEVVRPDVAFLDVDLGRRDDLRVVRDLRGALPRVKTILFTSRIDDEAFVEALRMGVRGVLLKSVASATIVACVREVCAGRYWIERRTAARALRKTVQREAAYRLLSRAGLTPREIEILGLAARGIPRGGIAATLGISPATVKVHLHQVYRKVGISDRPGLVAYARDHALIHP